MAASGCHAAGENVIQSADAEYEPGSVEMVRATYKNITYMG